jgi:hypothetical protein
MSELNGLLLFGTLDCSCSCYDNMAKLAYAGESRCQAGLARSARPQTVPDGINSRACDSGEPALERAFCRASALFRI